MGEIEAIGDVASAGLLARAVEPEAGEADGHTHENNCLNCGCALMGPHCHCCGQKAHVHRTLGAFFHDLVHGVFHFEGKIWRTLPMLAWRPGELTRRYIEGQRARFVSPMAMFLFTVFLMFATFSLLGLGKVNNIGLSYSSTQIESALEEEKRKLASLNRQRAGIPEVAGPQAARALDGQIAQKREEIAALDGFLRVGRTSNADSDGPQTGWGLFDEGYKKLKANPALALYKVQTNAYKFSWALIPISLPFLWLLFLHRRRYRQYRAYDHVVFITYSISFMSMAIILMAALKLVPHSGWLRIAMVLLPPLHMYRQLRGAYQLGRWSAAWRAAVLNVFAAIAITIFLLLLFAVGVFG